MQTGANPCLSTTYPIAGEITVCINPYAPVSDAPANAARSTPNKSSGNAYKFTDIIVVHE